MIDTLLTRDIDGLTPRFASRGSTVRLRLPPPFKNSVNYACFPQKPPSLTRNAISSDIIGFHAFSLVQLGQNWGTPKGLSFSTELIGYRATERFAVLGMALHSRPDLPARQDDPACPYCREPVRPFQLRCPSCGRILG